MTIIKTLYALLVLIGLVLMGINCVGLVLPLRNPVIYTTTGETGDTITLTEEQFYARVSQREPSDKAYTVKVNEAIYDGLMHTWPDEVRQADRYHWRVPIYENYLLFAMSYIYPNLYERYEYCDYRKAIARGIGLCSQHAIILNGVLEDQGITAHIIALSDLHVVATAQVDREQDTWWVFDPDYSVVIKHDIDTIRADPEIIKPYYREAGYSSAVADQLVGWYSANPFGVVHSVEEYCTPQKVQIEQATYVLIWVLPILLMLIGALPYVRHLRVSRR